ncbi:DUF6538 domain-containing protein [Stenotrophomonas maltophilia]|uniref:DUF6538 domain-containing protein n=1 Tax=Stenotrophomonas maltophilia TaxID=40324 RepID=UPI003F8218C0
MRIPHHLVRSSAGHWFFRQRVPIELQSVLGRQVVKHPLHTKELPYELDDLKRWDVILDIAHRSVERCGFCAASESPSTGQR